MKQMNRNVLKVLECVTRKEAEKSKYPWPPLCSGLLHQPKRPESKKSI